MLELHCDGFTEAQAPAQNLCAKKHLEAENLKLNTNEYKRMQLEEEYPLTGAVLL